MTKAIGALLALQLAFAPPALGQAALDSIVPDRPAGLVTDVAGVLDAATRARVEARLGRLRDSTGAEVAVVTLDDLRGRAAAEVAVAIGRRWGVGGSFPVGDPRRNAGAVLLLVPRTAGHAGAIDLRSGSGSEGFLTDARAGRILDAVMPSLRDAEYGAAIDRATTLLADLFARELGSADSALVVPSRRVPASRILVFVLVLAIVLALVLVVGGVSGGPPRGGGRRRGGWGGPTIWGGGFGRGGFGHGGFGGGGFGGGFGGFGGGGGFSGGGAGRGF